MEVKAPLISANTVVAPTIVSATLIKALTIELLSVLEFRAISLIPTVAAGPIIPAMPKANCCAASSLPIQNNMKSHCIDPYCFNLSSNAFAAGCEDAGFCPVINSPSVTT